MITQATRPQFVFAALALAGLLSATADAATRSWDGGGGADTDWTTGANWDVFNTVPSPSDTAQFDRGAALTYTVTFPFLAPFGGDITTDRLIVGSNSVTFANDRSNTNYLVTEPTTIEADPILGMPVRGITIGAEANDTAAVLISHLSLLQAVATTLGHAAGSSGTLTLDQNNDQFNVTGASSPNTELIIGRLGTGVLNVSGGADVHVNGQSGFAFGNALLASGNRSSGTANISGSGSTWDIVGPLTVGERGNGTLNILSSGVVTSADGVVGQQTGSTGTATVDGNNSRWTINGNFDVAGAGAGSLQITNGGRVVMNGTGGSASYIGRFDTAVGEVVVNSARWDNSRNLFVGFEGTGTLTILQGQVTNLVAYLGSNSADPTKTGSATVSGIGALWNNTNLIIGNVSTGTLRIEAGGVVTSVHGIVGGDVESVGDVTVTGSDGQGNVSTWNSGGELTVGSFSKDASLMIEAGGLVLSSAGWIGFGMGSSGTVSVSGTDGDGNHSTWTNSGDLVLGNSDMSMGTLTIEAGGRVANANAFISNLAGSTGDVIVTGAESTWTNTGNLHVGFADVGALSILGGGAVSNVNGSIGGMDGDGTVTVSGNGSTWTNDNELLIGDGAMGVGTLTIEAGGSVSDETGSIAFDAAATGNVTVTGMGSTWTHGDFLRVGDSGVGTLTIAAGGSVSNDGDGFVAAGTNSEGTAAVTGNGSTWTSGGDLYIANGDMATGTLSIEAGAAVSNVNGSIAHNDGSDGTVTVTDATWTNSMDLVVGNEDMSIGTLNIQAGGTVSNFGTAIGNNAGSDGTVTVAGAEAVWTTSGSLRVGFFGMGKLMIQSNGRVSSPNASIGAEANSVGTATVTGAGSAWTNNGELRVGNAGMGALNILNGAALTNSHGLIGALAGSTGAATVSGAGSTWTMSGRLSIGGNAAAGAGGGAGTLRIQPGGAVSVAQEIVLFTNGLVDFEGGALSTPAVSFLGGGQFDWTGGTLHVGTFNGNLVNQGGTLAPGQSAGSTTIVGNYTQQATAVLDIEIGGLLVNAEHDFVNATGNALLGGNLQLSLINGFVPAPLDTFTIFNAGSLLGFFSNVTNGQRLTTTDGAGSFLVHYGPTSVLNPNQIVLSNFELAVQYEADFDNDGDVDGADLNQWQGDFGVNAMSDADNDGDSDGADFLTWQRQLGSAAAAGITSAAVPEPNSLLLLALVFMPAIAMRPLQNAE